MGIWHTFFGHASFTQFFFDMLLQACGTPYLGLHLLFLFAYPCLLVGILEKVVMERGVLFCGNVDGNILLSSSVEV